MKICLAGEGAFGNKHLDALAGIEAALRQAEAARLGWTYEAAGLPGRRRRDQERPPA